MNILNEIAPKFVVTLDKFAIGLPHAEVIETKGKFLIFYSNMPIDETLYDASGCSVLDSEFVEKLLHCFTDGSCKLRLEYLEFAIKHKVFMDEVDEYKAYLESTDKPDTAAVWRNAPYNTLHKTVGTEYISGPKNGFIDTLKKELSWGDIRLGVFEN